MCVPKCRRCYRDFGQRLAGTVGGGEGPGDRQEKAGLTVPKARRRGGVAREGQQQARGGGEAIGRRVFKMREATPFPIDQNTKIGAILQESMRSLERPDPNTKYAVSQGLH
ncbi:unnamed protein product [Ostreobium quekettii]|uniref:Uncharacterized protein n=1 Tax=Ostreobium quekettii TaxID=121088 RepID=A0A8S1IKG5_9CHLO|nr:unnamed protein product [Ostreobium quekettii]